MSWPTSTRRKLSRWPAPPEDEMGGQNTRALPVVMQNHGKDITVVWPAEIETQEPVLPLPATSPYAMG